MNKKHNFFSLFWEKVKRQYSAGSQKVNEILGIGNIWFAYWNFSSRNDLILLKTSAFHELQVLLEWDFWYIFQLSIFTLKEFSKLCLIFFYFLTVFAEATNVSRQQLLFNHILKESLVPKNLQIIRKKQA